MHTTRLSDELLASLALACVQQLEAEEAHLLETIQCLETLRRCAIRGDLEALRQSMQSHQTHQITSQQIAQARGALRHRLAAALAIPEQQVTIRGFADIAPRDYAERLLTLRRRLVPLVTRANSLGHSIVMLVQQSMDLMRDFLECFTGQPAGSRYSSLGGRVEQTGEPLVQYRC